MPDDFVEHALTYHPKAALFLKQFTYYKSKLKEEAINYQDYYGDDDDDTDRNNISNANDSLFAFNNSVDEQIIKLEKDHDNTTLNNPEEETLSYKNAADDVKFLTGIYISSKTQQRLVHRQEYKLPKRLLLSKGRVLLVSRWFLNRCQIRFSKECIMEENLPCDEKG